MGWLKNIVAPDVIDLEKARKAEVVNKSKAWSFDPNELRTGLYGGPEVAEHQGTLGVNYNTLMVMSRVPIIGAIIQLRTNQLAEFAMPQMSRYGLGFKIAMRDKKAKATTAAENQIKEIQTLIQTCGGYKYEPQGFEGFMRKIVRDSLTYDQANFEVVYNKAGKPGAFCAVDAMTIRRAIPKDAKRKGGAAGLDSNDKDAFVQVLGNKQVAEFGRQEMAWGIRRPRTWMRVNGYGYPELEESMRIITNLLNAAEYNSNNFTHGVHANSILTVKSGMSKEVFAAFRRQFYAMVSGVRNAKRTPIIQLDPEMKEEISNVSMSQSNKEMEYSNWMSFLLKVLCSVYGLDAAELGFVYGNEGQAASLSQKGPEERIVASKERGLRPLVRAVQGWMNQWVVYPVDEDFEIQFVGFDAHSESEKVELDTKAVKAFKTVNEIRAEHDLPPLEDSVADMVLDPTYVQFATAGGEEEGGEEEGDYGSYFDDSKGDEGEDDEEKGEEEVPSGKPKKPEPRKKEGDKGDYNDSFEEKTEKGLRTVTIEVT